MKLEKALKKYGYLRLPKKNGYVYAVKELTWEEIENKNVEKEPPPKPPEQSSICVIIPNSANCIGLP